MKTHFLLIIGMTLVTYLPRYIPLVLLRDRKIHPKLEQFLIYIPFTSLSILILRGILATEADLLLATLVGLGVAGGVSWKKSNLILAVLSGIIASLIILNIF